MLPTTARGTSWERARRVENFERKYKITNYKRNTKMFNEFFLERTTRANLITAQIGSDVCRAEIKWSRKLKSFQSTYDRKKKTTARLPKHPIAIVFALSHMCVCVVALVVVVVGRDESHLLVEPSQGKPCQLVSGVFFSFFWTVWSLLYRFVALWGKHSYPGWPGPLSCVWPQDKTSTTLATHFSCSPYQLELGCVLAGLSEMPVWAS